MILWCFQTFFSSQTVIRVCKTLGKVNNGSSCTVDLTQLCFSRKFMFQELIHWKTSQKCRWRTVSFTFRFNRIFPSGAWLQTWILVFLLCILNSNYNAFWLREMIIHIFFLVLLYRNERSGHARIDNWTRLREYKSFVWFGVLFVQGMKG